ncbi:MAG: ATP-dependent protease ATPase subunit HslU [Acidobacteria bacterium]|nr:MAG: ATP-dependent protease ATPase subunit HslU [Acidobacteriota bacterium]MCE7957576.1 ATP-dependent protease ATPase subunit HslU [Acidobacteria bacterium ACB2]
MRDLSPRRIVAELDRHVVGQARAKRAVAIALRDRWRRQRLPAEVAEEIVPKNILMIGPTGVGKTEIARRLARLADAPFVKVEASKFTEVGYVGRDVDSIARDLVEAAVRLVKEERRSRVMVRAASAAEERLLDLLVSSEGLSGAAQEGRERLRRDLREGRLETREVEVEVTDERTPQISVMTPQGVEEMGIDLPGPFGNLFGGKKKKVRLPVADARPILLDREADALSDEASVPQEAIRRAEEAGIVFLDEIDKVAGRQGAQGGPDVSREGVQRDLLPLVEGTVVKTKHGNVRTDHVLFVAAGAFHVARPSDMIPELQGRFPIRVELDALTEADFVRILSEPEHALPRQAASLLSADGIDLTFAEDGIAEVARAAAELNRNLENIGARRLHTILERVLEEVSFAGPDAAGARIVVDRAYVERALSGLVRDRDLSRFVL